MSVGEEPRCKPDVRSFHLVTSVLRTRVKVEGEPASQNCPNATMTCTLPHTRVSHPCTRITTHNSFEKTKPKTDQKKKKILNLNEVQIGIRSDELKISWLYEF